MARAVAGQFIYLDGGLKTNDPENRAILSFGSQAASRLRKVFRMNTVANSFESVNRGLPNVVRERLLAMRQGEVALVLDALYFAGCSTGIYLTVAQIRALMGDWGPSDRVIRKAVAQSFGSFSGQEQHYFKQGWLPGKRTRGRPALTYRIPHYDQVRDWVSPGELSPTDWLRRSDFKNLKSYRVGLHREYVRRMADESGGKVQLTRGFMAARLGVSKRTVGRYDVCAGIESEAQYRRQVLTADKLRIVPHAGLAAGDRYLWLEGIMVDGRRIAHQFKHYLAWKLLQICEWVEIVERRPNLYWIGAVS